MHRSSNSHYGQWAHPSGSHSTPSYPSASPGPMPSAPHLRTVSLPHPNSMPYHGSSSSSSHYFEGTPSIASLHPLLSWSGAPPLYYNVANDVQYIRLQPGCSSNQLRSPAMHPPCRVLRLSVPSLPWSTIEVRNEQGVSVYDVLVRIRDFLNRGASQAEMGVKRIDFLGPNVFFAGLSRSMNGQDLWEVCFVPNA